MHFNIVPSSKRTRCVNATAAGTTTINGTAVDMQDYECVVFDALFGALTATQVTFLKAQGGNASDGSDAVDLAGTKVGPLLDAQGTFVLTLEVVRPVGFRYVRPVVVRGTANAGIDGVIATQYHVRRAPTTDDTATVAASKVVVSPAAGTP